MQPDAALQFATDQLKKVRDEIGKVIVGQQDVVDGVLICLLGGGHVLLEGVPGLGKTTLLRTLARVLQLKYSRIQFTPDLMPADIVGSMIIDTEDGSKTLRFQPGPIFAHLVLADEINRATPKTQSALLEAMQEHTVTSGTATHELEAPFLVRLTATLNSRRSNSASGKSTSLHCKPVPETRGKMVRFRTGRVSLSRHRVSPYIKVPRWL